MSVNTLSVGVSWTVNMQTQQGELILPTITSMDKRSTSEMRKSVPVNQPVKFIVIPQGYMGTIEIDRENASLELFWSQYESLYYSGVDITAATITETIVETGNQINQWVLAGVVFDTPDFGAWSGDNYVKQKLTFYGSTWERQ